MKRKKNEEENDENIIYEYEYETIVATKQKENSILSEEINKEDEKEDVDLDKFLDENTINHSLIQPIFSEDENLNKISEKEKEKTSLEKVPIEENNTNNQAKEIVISNSKKRKEEKIVTVDSLIPLADHVIELVEKLGGIFTCKKTKII